MTESKETKRPGLVATVATLMGLTGSVVGGYTTINNVFVSKSEFQEFKVDANDSHLKLLKRYEYGIDKVMEVRKENDEALRGELHQVFSKLNHIDGRMDKLNGRIDKLIDKLGNQSIVLFEENDNKLRN